MILDQYHAQNFIKYVYLVMFKQNKKFHLQYTNYQLLGFQSVKNMYISMFVIHINCNKSSEFNKSLEIPHLLATDIKNLMKAYEVIISDNITGLNVEVFYTTKESSNNTMVLEFKETGLQYSFVDVRLQIIQQTSELEINATYFIELCKNLKKDIFHICTENNQIYLIHDDTRILVDEDKYILDTKQEIDARYDVKSIIQTNNIITKNTKLALLTSYPKLLCIVYSEMRPLFGKDNQKICFDTLGITTIEDKTYYSKTDLDVPFGEYTVLNKLKGICFENINFKINKKKSLYKIL